MICNDPKFQGVSGTVGDKVYRQINGKTFVSKMPRKPNASKRTVAQKSTNASFAKASKIAKERSQNPLLRPGYLALAKALKLPNAYTAALIEQLRSTGLKYDDQ